MKGLLSCQTRESFLVNGNRYASSRHGIEWAYLDYDHKIYRGGEQH